MRRSGRGFSLRRSSLVIFSIDHHHHRKQKIKLHSQHLASLYCVAAFSRSSAASSYLFPPKSENDERRFSAFFTRSRARAAAPSVAAIEGESRRFFFSFLPLLFFARARRPYAASAVGVAAREKSSRDLSEKERRRGEGGELVSLSLSKSKERRKKKVMAFARSLSQRHSSLSLFFPQSIETNKSLSHSTLLLLPSALKALPARRD